MVLPESNSADINFSHENRSLQLWLLCVCTTLLKQVVPRPKFSYNKLKKGELLAWSPEQTNFPKVLKRVRFDFLITGENHLQ